jgi:hypothetical protein
MMVQRASNTQPSLHQAHLQPRLRPKGLQAAHQAQTKWYTSAISAASQTIPAHTQHTPELLQDTQHTLLLLLTHTLSMYAFFMVQQQPPADKHTRCTLLHPTRQQLHNIIGRPTPEMPA